MKLAIINMSKLATHFVWPDFVSVVLSIPEDCAVEDTLETTDQSLASQEISRLGG